jgi:excinuclease UvrABC nuclease subunit
MAEWSNRYLYNEDNVKKHATTSGGVYRLIYKNGDEYYVFYVGQSDDLERRLLEHLSNNESNECIKKHLRGYTCYFRFIEVSSSSERDRIEKEEIEKYKPSCNS